MAQRCCSLCGEFYTDKTGHNYNICVERCFDQLERAKAAIPKAIDRVLDAYKHLGEAKHIEKQDWWKGETIEKGGEMKEEIDKGSLTWLYDPTAKPPREISKHDKKMIQFGWDTRQKFRQDRPALREKLVEILYGETTYKNYAATPKLRQYADDKINQILPLLPDEEEIRKQERGKIFRKIERTFPEFAHNSKIHTGYQSDIDEWNNATDKWQALKKGEE